MTYATSIKRRAIALRKVGKSIISIGKELDIAKSTISKWCSRTPLTRPMREMIEGTWKRGYQKGLAVLKAQRELERVGYKKDALRIIQKVLNKPSKKLLQVLAAVMFWCEGGKRHLDQLKLTNSDPQLIKTFLKLLRAGFKIDNKRLRAMIHLHEYHNEGNQIKFWSKVTQIPRRYFYKSYLKPHTKIRIRENYQGCIAIYYYDATLARRLDALYHVLAESIGA